MGLLILIAALAWFGSVGEDTARECHPRSPLLHDRACAAEVARGLSRAEPSPHGVVP